MTTPEPVNKSNGLETVLAAYMVLLNSYKHIVNLDEAVPAKLIEDAFDRIAKLNRTIRRLKLDIAKMDTKKGGKH